LSLLPKSLDDWVDESNPVRVIDAFVDALDLGDLGFDGVDPAATGRLAYHPSINLKLFIYGYLNRVQSRRRLEPEADRNVGQLAPDQKTIAYFRKDNGPAHFAPGECAPRRKHPCAAHDDGIVAFTVPDMALGVSANSLALIFDALIPAADRIVHVTSDTPTFSRP
jgi:hypothetical protein